MGLARAESRHLFAQSRLDTVARRRLDSTRIRSLERRTIPILTRLPGRPVTGKWSGAIGVVPLVCSSVPGDCEPWRSQTTFCQVNEIGPFSISGDECLESADGVTVVVGFGVGHVVGREGVAVGGVGGEVPAGRAQTVIGGNTWNWQGWKAGGLKPRSLEALKLSGLTPRPGS